MLRALSSFALATLAWAQAPPTVATHYFYWYHWPTEHFDQAGAPGREGHTHHLREPERVSYLDPAWHRAQLDAMAAAGIDVALPVYWGAPGAYDRPGISFSRRGLPPLVEALDERLEEGRRRVGVGLFYDTSTLLDSVRGIPGGGRADLTEAAGRELFCRTVVEFFAAIPDRHWARHRGRPLVVLYVAAFAAAKDDRLGPALRTAFDARFPGEDPFLVADASWGEIGQDATTAWGAALHGPRIHGAVAQVGPGYDDTPVPGRRTPIRDREDGAFYAWSWRQAVVARPELVLIETWNEMHEGTEVCETIETGTRYLELTRAWVDRLRRGEPGPEIELAHAAPRPRPDRSWGRDAAGAERVARDFRGGPGRGLRAIPWEDGPIEAGDEGLRSVGAAGRYLYLQVSDWWRFDDDVDLVLELEWAGDGEVGVEFDSRDPRGVFDGSYTAAARVGRREADGGVAARFALPRARLANRQNGGADLRLLVRGEVVLRRAALGAVE